jgi:hypothetical protein
MAVVAMCYYLLREEVTHKMQRLRARISEKMLKCRKKDEKQSNLSKWTK